MFEFLFVIGIVLAFYGYSAMKNPNVWGDQGRDEIRPENWNGYVVHNGQFLMYTGFFWRPWQRWMSSLTLPTGCIFCFYWVALHCCSTRWPTGCTKKRANGGHGRSIKRKSEVLPLWPSTSKRV